MTRFSRPALLAALAVVALALGLLAGPQPAHATPVELRGEVVAPGGDVTLGDLFENAGAAADVVVANGGPDGGSLVLSARHVQELAAANGLEWANSRNMNRLIARVEPVAVRGGAARTIRIGSSVSLGGQRVVVTGQILVYSRDLNAGEIVGPQDIVWSVPSGFGTPLDAARDSRSVIGQAVRRPLRAGSAVSMADLASPKMIKKDEMVQVAYSAGGIRLVLQGKAMSTAGLGEAVDILNPASKKVFQAVAVGLDQAVVGPDADRIRSSPPASQLYASLR